MGDSGSVAFSSAQSPALNESEDRLPKPAPSAEIPLIKSSLGLKMERGREIEGFTDFSCLHTPPPDLIYGT